MEGTMALLPSELDQIKFELGWNTLTIGAVPYVGIAAIFERVVQPYLNSGLVTTGHGYVASASAPTCVDVHLEAVSGVNTQGTPVSVQVGDRIVLDVDYAQEVAVVQGMNGNLVTVQLRLAHEPPYPVTVVGGEAMVRYILRRCWAVREKIERSDSREGIKKVDEIEFFENRQTGGSTALQGLMAHQDYWRSELRRVLFGAGDPNLTTGGSGSGSGRAIAVY
jgi:hypothetical protein